MGKIYAFPSNKTAPDYKKNRYTTYVRGSWHYQLITKFAWLPVKTEDAGWIWLFPYLYFRTATGYDKHGWTWVVQGRTLSASAMERIKNRFFKMEEL